MKRIIYFFFNSYGTICLRICFFKSTDWKFGENYVVKFTSSNPSGEFKGLKGIVSFDESTLAASKFDVSVDVSSINTGNGMKNLHAKSERWLDSEKYPPISFVSTTIKKTAAGYDASSNLQMHGVTKEVTIPFTFQKTTTGGIFTGTFDIDRLDYNINTAEPNDGEKALKIDLNIPVFSR
jgi:polyisoprenoid-binding protein YceI